MTCIGAILDLLFSVSGVTIPGVFEYYHSPNYCVIISLTSQRTSPSSILIVRDFQFNPSLKPTAVPSPKRHEVREKWSVLAETCWRDYPLTSRNTPDEWRKETVCSSNDCWKKLGFCCIKARIFPIYSSVYRFTCKRLIRLLFIEVFGVSVRLYLDLDLTPHVTSSTIWFLSGLSFLSLSDAHECSGDLYKWSHLSLASRQPTVNHHMTGWWVWPWI